MSGFNGINQFGSLTTQNGQKLSFKDFDKDGNGVISQEEYESLLKEVKLDSVELSTVDKNGDKQLTEQEFTVWEQKIQMQNSVNALQAKISAQFTGDRAKYIQELTNALKQYIDDFAGAYSGNIADMAEAFKKALPEKYESIKNELLVNDSGTIKSKVLEEIYSSFQNVSPETKAIGSNSVSEGEAKAIAAALEKEAETFVKSYKGSNLEEALKAHLQEFLQQSDATKMKDAVSQYEQNIQGFGAYIDNSEFAELKEYVKEFLTQAVKQGVIINLGGKNVASTAAITSAIAQFKDADSLLAAMEDAIKSISTLSKKNEILEKYNQEQAAAADAAFTNIKGSEYQVKPELIDWTKVDSRYFDGGDIYERGKGWGGSKDKAYDKGFELLSNDSLKSQLKAQIEKMLKAKGVPFEKIETIFENVYNQSIQDALNTDGMITGRGAKGCSKKGKAYIDVKTLCDTFISKFNENIEKVIDEMNKSDKDMDIIDLNLTGLNKDENGNEIAEHNEDFVKLYNSGETTTVKKHGADYYLGIAAKIIDGLKAQMLQKAHALCKANGVEFNNEVFETMFNSAKSIAMNAAVTGTGSKGSANRVATNAVKAAATTASAIAIGGAIGGTIGATISAFTFVKSMFGHHSESTLNTKTLIDTFNQTLKESMETWVETEKNNQANKK